MNLRQALRSSLIFLLLLGLPVWAKPAADPLHSFVRSSNGTLETSIVTFHNAKGQSVDLVSAVHIGSSAYYKALNNQFKGYDAVLYELILPDEMAGKPLPAGMDTGSGVSGMQHMMATSMGLVTQLEKIDYSAPNFVHADLTQSGLSQKMGERNEDFMGYLMQALSKASSDPKAGTSMGISDEELSKVDFGALLSGQAKPQDRKVLRKLFAGALSSSGGLMSGMNNTTLIAERNKQALSVLDRESKSGKNNLAIFYGAAHMPDMQRRLEKAGWRRSSVKWVKAWSN